MTGQAQPGIDTSDATATAARILSPYTAYANGQKLTGSITQRSASSETLQGTSKTYYSGYYPSSWTVTGKGSISIVYFGIYVSGHYVMYTNGSSVGNVSASSGSFNTNYFTLATNSGGFTNLNAKTTIKYAMAYTINASWQSFKTLNNGERESSGFTKFIIIV